MAKAKTRGTGARSTPQQGAEGRAVQERLRELVTAIAAEVIAEAAERLGPARRAMPLLIARGTRSGPRPKKRR